MTCQGPGWDMGQILGGCSISWFSLVIILFLGLILRRQCEDGFLAGTGFNLVGALALGLGSAIVVISLTGNARWALVIGVVGLALGGYLLGLRWDQSGGGDYE